MKTPPAVWEHLGCALERGEPGSPDASVTGDPCIVWDEDMNAWRMFYFGQRHAAGAEVNCVMHALSMGAHGVGPGQWTKCGPITYTNPQALPGDAHKPYILMDAYNPNRAAKIHGDYVLYMVLWETGHKRIYRAHAASLAGPWTFEEPPVLSLGSPEAFDGYHVDTVSAYHFADRGETLLLYKGYPTVPQTDTLGSPYGSRSAAAWIPDGQATAERGNVLLCPDTHGAWYGGWVGGMQLIPAEDGGWWALCNASPTPPKSVDEEPDMREPAPSLGGWAKTTAQVPVAGWVFEREPITMIENLPLKAIEAGEGVNLWRHHLLITGDGNAYLFYNSGPYGSERLFVRRAVLS